MIVSSYYFSIKTVKPQIYVPKTMLQSSTSVTKSEKFFPVPCTDYNDLTSHISSKGIGFNTFINTFIPVPERVVML